MDLPTGSWRINLSQSLERGIKNNVLTDDEILLT